jgi:hypothetical protein
MLTVCCPFVVDDAAPEPDAVAFGELPGGEPRLPAIVLSAHDVAVPVAQHRRQTVTFAAFGHQERCLCLRMFQHPATEPHRLERRNHLVAQIALHVGRALGVLAFGGDRHATRQGREQGAGVELRGGACDRGVPAGVEDLRGSGDCAHVVS